MENIVREMLIRNIFEIDLNNKEEIFSDIMLDGFKGYNNMTTFELMKIYIEYNGVEKIEFELEGLIKNNPIYSWDSWIHLAYKGDRNTNLYYNISEWCVCIDGVFFGKSSLFEALIEFGFDENFLHEERV